MSPEFAEVMKAQQADRDFVNNVDGAQTSVQITIEETVAQNQQLMTPRAEAVAPVFTPRQ